METVIVSRHERERARKARNKAAEKARRIAAGDVQVCLWLPAEIIEWAKKQTGHEAARAAVSEIVRRANSEGAE